MPVRERDGLKYFNSRLSISTYGGCDEDIEGMRGADHSTVSVARKKLSEKTEHDTKVKQRFRELEDRLHIQE